MFFRYLPFIRVYYAETSAAFIFSVPAVEGGAFAPYWHMLDAVEKTFAAGIERGLFVSLPTRVLAASLEGVHNSFLSAIIRDENAYTAEQTVEFTRRIFFESIALSR